MLDGFSVPRGSSYCFCSFTLFSFLVFLRAPHFIHSGKLNFFFCCCLAFLSVCGFLGRQAAWFMLVYMHECGFSRQSETAPSIYPRGREQLRCPSNLAHMRALAIFLFRFFFLRILVYRVRVAFFVDVIYTKRIHYFRRTRCLKQTFLRGCHHE